MKTFGWYKEWLDKRMKDPEFRAGYEEYFAELINDEVMQDPVRKARYDECMAELIFEGAMAELKREETANIKCVSVTPKDEKEFKTIVDTLRRYGKE